MAHVIAAYFPVCTCSWGRLKIIYKIVNIYCTIRNYYKRLFFNIWKLHIKLLFAVWIEVLKSYYSQYNWIYICIYYRKYFSYVFVVCLFLFYKYWSYSCTIWLCIRCVSNQTALLLRSTYFEDILNLFLVLRNIEGIVVSIPKR